MKMPLVSFGPIRAIVAAILIAGAGAAFAANQPPPTPSKEVREKMAAAHEKMAACLRSDKAFADCRSEMQQSCHALGEQNCPIMGMGMQGGMGRRPPPEKPDGT